jgi:mono/diheme cytochrome c family protein
MRLLRRILVVLVVLLIAAQVVPVNRENPPADPARDFYTTEKVPQNLRAIFDRSCANCHSNQTRWPWYSHVAPVSWLVANDVHEARHHVNFSEWGNYDAKKRDHDIEEICNEILEGDMPDTKYTLIHRNARLSQEEREAVCQWTGSPH